MNEILKINNVTKYYGSGSVVTKALDGISFTVEKGEFTAIMGASGSGKSTLLNVISTIDRVSSGDIYVGGQHLSEMKEEKLSVFRRDQLGFIFQEYNLLDTLTTIFYLEKLQIQYKGQPFVSVSVKIKSLTKFIFYKTSFYIVPSAQLLTKRFVF